MTLFGRHDQRVEGNDALPALPDQQRVDLWR
jgi:hypothetical protein